MKVGALKNSINNNLQYLERKPHQLFSWFSCGSSIFVELEFGDISFVQGEKPENPVKPL